MLCNMRDWRELFIHWTKEQLDFYEGYLNAGLHNIKTKQDVWLAFFFIVGMDPWMLIKVLGYGCDVIPSLLLPNKSSTSSLSLCWNCVNSLSIKVPVRRKQEWDGGRCLGSKEQQVVPGLRSMWLATTEETHVFNVDKVVFCLFISTATWSSCVSFSFWQDSTN